MAQLHSVGFVALLSGCALWPPRASGSRVEVSKLLAAGGDLSTEGAAAVAEGISSTSHIFARWQAYVTATAEAYAPAGGIQPGCVPKMYKHSGTYKGAVMLMHGFTACPQQFNDLAPLLTAAGFTVFTPLLPGHGATYKEVEVTKKGVVEKVIEDNIDMMPDTKEGYHKFAEDMNAIMASAGGETALMGLSLGGAVATYAGSKYNYTRQLLAVPLIDVPAHGAIIALARRVNFRLSPLSFLREKRIGWGVPCEAERAGGRAGICQFNLRKLMAGRDLGHNALGVHVHSRDPASVQVVFTEGDGAVSVQGVQDLATKLGAGRGSPHSCGFDKAVGHSFLSAFDTPSENKYWLSEVTQTVAAFLADGTPFAQEGVIDPSPFWPRCKVTCTAQSCPYHAAAAVAPSSQGLLAETAEELEAQLEAE